MGGVLIKPRLVTELPAVVNEVKAVVSGVMPALHDAIPVAKAVLSGTADDLARVLRAPAELVDNLRAGMDNPITTPGGILGPVPATGPGGAVGVTEDATRAVNLASAAPEVVNEGIYVVRTETKAYVGQSGNIDVRSSQHVASGKFTQAEVDAAERISVLGGKTQREIAEQLKIDEMGGIDDLLNVVNPIGLRRLDLMPEGYTR